jgi:DNA polymerase-4
MNEDVRHIAHLDMDAFYASVELLRYPELKGQPVVIGGGSASTPKKNENGDWVFSTLAQYAGRGVATTSTYEARALGVHSAMGLMKAAKLAPDAVLLPTDFNSYRHYSKLFKSAVIAIAPTIEDRGIDEIFIDLTGLTDDIPSLIRQMQQAVFEATGLSCSIGVAPNKLLAKICSELEKPKGLTIIDQADIQTRIWPMPVKKINGIGPKATEKLAQINIHTIEELARADLGLLQSNFGRTYSAWLSRVAQGIDDRPVATRSEPKSMSRETTFEKDLHAVADRRALTPLFTKLCEKVSDDLVRKGYVGKTIGVKLRFSDFSIVTRDITLTTSTNDAAIIRQAAGECLRRVSFDKRLRLLGVKVNGLSKPDASSQRVEAVQGELVLS